MNQISSRLGGRGEQTKGENMKPWYKILGLVLLIAAAHTIHKKEVDRFHHDLRQQRITYEGMLTAQELRLKDYFAAHGASEPATIAKAVGTSKRKVLTAVVAKRESRGNPKAVGDSGASRGLYQVQGKHWKKVSANPEAQTVQHDRIMDELMAETGNLPQAIERYNGQGRDARKYKKETIKESIRLAQELGL